MSTEKRELRRIGVFSSVKTLFLLGGLGGFLIGLFEWIFLGMIMMVGRGASEFVPELEGLMGAGVGIAGVFFPIFGAIFGAVGGVVLGGILTTAYNLGARLWGGVEFELAEQTELRPVVVRHPVSVSGVSPLPHPAPVVPPPPAGEPPTGSPPPTYE